jgi:hypothetical protein
VRERELFRRSAEREHVDDAGDGRADRPEQTREHRPEAHRRPVRRTGAEHERGIAAERKNPAANRYRHEHRMYRVSCNRGGGAHDSSSYSGSTGRL